MRNKKTNEIRTAKEDIKIGTRVRDRITGKPAVLVKGKGEKYDTITAQEIIEALYGQGAKVTIQTT